MRRMALLLLMVALVAGCIRAEQATLFHATASQPKVLAGYDYGAVTVQPGQGGFEVSTDAAADTGTATATFTFAGRQFQAAFTRFAEAPGRAFQEGGVRADFQEHGATGNGDALLPEIHALSAGWGHGTLTVDGQALADPATGAAEFNLHYMVTDTAPRDPGTMLVTRADGTSPYDPATPGDARTLPGTLQVLLNIQSAGGAAPTDTTAMLEGTVAEPQHSNSMPFDVNATGARILVNISVSNPTPLPSVGELSFVLGDPSGAELGRFDYSVQEAQPMGVIDVPAANATGTYTLSVSGAGLGVDYRAGILVDYPEPVFLHVVYTDVRVG